MSSVDVAQLRAGIKARGFNWEAHALPQGYKPRGLGWNPAPPEVTRAALENAQRLMLTRMPELFRAPMASGARAAAPGALAANPRSFDWRTRGAIGPVTDQRYCGSCVSFATTGLVGAMVAAEHGGASVHLSEADQHFCSAHGANCGGWNNGTALNQIKSRGVVADADCAYMTAFDSPPVGDPSDVPEERRVREEPRRRTCLPPVP